MYGEIVTLYVYGKIPFLKFTEVFYSVILGKLPLAKQAKREEDTKQVYVYTE